MMAKADCKYALNHDPMAHGAKHLILHVFLSFPRARDGYIRWPHCRLGFARHINRMDGFVAGAIFGAYLQVAL